MPDPPTAGRGSDGGPATRALAHPAFRRYYIGLWFSTLAFWMLRVALGWSAWQASGSAFGTGFVAALSMLPPALLAPLFGVVADRVPLRRAVVITALAFVAIATSLGALSLRGTPALASLVLIAGVHGIVAAAWQPLRLTLPARLVPRELLPATVGLSSMTFQVSRVTGPAIAGVLIARLGVTAVYALVALAYLAFVALFLTVALAPRQRDARDGDGFVARFVAGLRVAMAMREIRPTLAATLLGGLVTRGALELLPAVAGGTLGAGAGTLAWLTSAAGAGAVVGGLVSARSAGGADALQRRFVVTGAAGAAATLALGSVALLVGGDVAEAGAAAPAALATTALACAAVGFFATLTGVACQSLLQLVVADAYRGRVLSLWTTAGFGGATLGTLALGALGDRIGLGPALVLAGVVGMAGFAWLALAERAAAVSPPAARSRWRESAAAGRSRSASSARTAARR